MIVRFLLGAFESCVQPTFIILTSMWYTRRTGPPHGALVLHDRATADGRRPASLRNLALKERRHLPLAAPLHGPRAHDRRLGGRGRFFPAGQPDECQVLY
jgi:hypothetical protein